MKPKMDGSKQAFDANWDNREEARYLHWTREKPSNQIQLAFRQHWILFQELLKEAGVIGRRVLEVGCGRGSLSAYFADADYECTLLDASEIVITRAQTAFQGQALKSSFDVGDARQLPYSDHSFDVLFSIGLLEHFENIDDVLSEMVRVLAPGGMFFGYVVPQNPENIQKEYNWLNDILKTYAAMPSHGQAKAEVYRNSAGPEFYLKALAELPLENIQCSGAYPLPMISPSIEFPFTLMNSKAEVVLTDHFQRVLDKRAEETQQNPWLCDARVGQAFLIWGTKKASPE